MYYNVRCRLYIIKTKTELDICMYVLAGHKLSPNAKR